MQEMSHEINPDICLVHKYSTLFIAHHRFYVGVPKLTKIQSISAHESINILRAECMCSHRAGAPSKWTV